MKSTIQVYLECKEDVIRDIEIASDNNIEKLHFAIIEAFGLDKNEMASFYKTNTEFELLQEIPYISMDEKSGSLLIMKEVLISSIFTEKGSQLLYVYDFLKMWRFLITLSETSEEIIEDAQCVNKVGKMPKTAPDIQFEAKKEFDPFDEAFEDFDEFNAYEES